MLPTPCGMLTIDTVELAPIFACAGVGTSTFRPPPTGAGRCDAAGERHPMRLLRIVTLVPLLAAAAAPVEAALCKSRKGAVYSRDACKRKEVTLDLAAIGASPKGDPGPPGPTQPRLRAVDANGQRLPGIATPRGKLVSPAGSRSFSVIVRTDGFEGNSFFFDATDCTGPRLVEVSDDLYDAVPVVGSTAYYGGDPVLDHVTQSEAYPSRPEECMGPGFTYDPALGFCCYNQMRSTAAGPATPVELGGFTLPFRVEMEE